MPHIFFVERVAFLKKNILTGNSFNLDSKLIRKTYDCYLLETVAIYKYNKKINHVPGNIFVEKNFRCHIIFKV